MQAYNVQTDRPPPLQRGNAGTPNFRHILRGIFSTYEVPPIILTVIARRCPGRRGNLIL
jgi:hypothetical protein